MRWPTPWKPSSKLPNPPSPPSAAKAFIPNADGGEQGHVVDRRGRSDAGRRRAGLAPKAAERPAGHRAGPLDPRQLPLRLRVHAVDALHLDVELDLAAELRLRRAQA